jgi:phosphate transport system ATP-binding protein
MSDTHPKLIGIIKDLSIHFSGRQALSHVNLNLEAGALTVIVGRSGSGKSTFLRALNRLNEMFPGTDTTGSVELLLGGVWANVNQNGLPLPELRRRVGMVFQTPHVLPTTVERNLTLPLKLVMGLPKKEITGAMEEALRQAQLWDEVKDRLRHSASTLSGGQQQRLCLARSLALKSEFLLLDEPTASLDFRAAEKIEELIVELKQRYHILAVSHSMSQAKRIADRIIAPARRSHRRRHPIGILRLQRGLRSTPD